MGSISDVINFHCPRWKELPEIDLYMDQVVSILERYLNVFMEYEGDKIITPTMINNYVKQKVVDPPIKKRYNREHLAYFFVVYIMKRIISISEISDLLAYLINTYTIEQAYDLFCEELERSIQSVFLRKERDVEEGKEGPTHELMLLEAATLAFANKVYYQVEIKNIARTKAASQLLK